MQELIHKTKVYYADTDAGQVVYHANYLKFFEEARTEYIHAYNIKFRELEQSFEVLFAVKKLTIDFVKPARLEDEVYIFTKIQQIKRVSIIFSQNMRLNSTDGPIAANAIVKLGCVSSKDMSIQPIPEFILKKWR